MRREGLTCPRSSDHRLFESAGDPDPRRDLTDRVAEFLIGLADGHAPPSGEAGSHIVVHFGGSAGRFVRHYSLVGALRADRSEDAFWRIAVQREDRSRGSAYIHANWGRGTRLQASRPITAFKLGRNLPHTLVIAGGIGITPILSMLRSLVLRRRSASMLYVGRTRSTLAYADDVLAMGPERVTLHETSLSGRPDFSSLLAAQPDAAETFVCGQIEMIEAVRMAARQNGWGADRIHSEVFNAAHRPDDVGFDVKSRHGQIVHVPAASTILDSLEDAGVETYSDCRRGECGLCATDVRAAANDLDHRDTYLSETEKAAGGQICICVSRPKNGAMLILDLG